MRALAVLPELASRHELLIFAGSDAYDALSAAYDVIRIPTLKFVMKPNGKRSTFRTIVRNAPGMLDLSWGGPASGMVAEALEAFAPDVIVSDSEPWTHHVAARMKIPRISFDHFGVLVHCRWPMSWRDRLALRGEAVVYRKLIGTPDRVVIASFYAPPARREGVKVVGAVLRSAVREKSATDGEHLLVYFSNGQKNYAPAIHQALTELDLPVWVYGAPRDGRDGNVEFRPLSNTQFVEDLASCRAVFSTAGNQLISEAMHFGKPLLLMPEDSLEQQLNAATVQRLEYGMHAPRNQVSSRMIQQFLAGRDAYSRNLLAAASDGAAEAVAAIERYAAELSGSSGQ